MEGKAEDQIPAFLICGIFQSDGILEYAVIHFPTSKNLFQGLIRISEGAEHA